MAVAQSASYGIDNETYGPSPGDQSAPSASSDRGTARKAIDVGAATVTRSDYATAGVMQTVRILGGAMIGIAVLVVVLNEVFSLEAINGTEGEFSGVVSSLTSTGSAALGLLVIGLLVLAANRVMGFFGGNGF